MHLARLLHRTVDELLDTMSYPELIRWAEYFELFGEPEWRADVRAAQVCATLANIHRDPKKRPKPYEPTEFLLFKRDRQKPAAPAPAAVSQPAADQGAKIAPETIMWLVAKARKGGAVIQQ